MRNSETNVERRSILSINHKNSIQNRDDDEVDEFDFQDAPFNMMEFSARTELNNANRSSSLASSAENIATKKSKKKKRRLGRFRKWMSSLCG